MEKVRDEKFAVFNVGLADFSVRFLVDNLGEYQVFSIRKGCTSWTDYYFRLLVQAVSE